METSAEQFENDSNTTFCSEIENEPQIYQEQLLRCLQERIHSHLNGTSLMGNEEVLFHIKKIKSLNFNNYKLYNLAQKHLSALEKIRNITDQFHQYLSQQELTSQPEPESLYELSQNKEFTQKADSSFQKICDVSCSSNESQNNMQFQTLSEDTIHIRKSTPVFHFSPDNTVRLDLLTNDNFDISRPSYEQQKNESFLTNKIENKTENERRADTPVLFSNNKNSNNSIWGGIDPASYKSKFVAESSSSLGEKSINISEFSSNNNEEVFKKPSQIIKKIKRSQDDTNNTTLSKKQKFDSTSIESFNSQIFSSNVIECTQFSENQSQQCVPMDTFVNSADSSKEFLVLNDLPIETESVCQNETNPVEVLGKTYFSETEPMIIDETPLELIESNVEVVGYSISENEIIINGQCMDISNNASEKSENKITVLENKVINPPIAVAKKTKKINTKNIRKYNINMFLMPVEDVKNNDYEKYLPKFEKNPGEHLGYAAPLAKNSNIFLMEQFKEYISEVYEKQKVGNVDVELPKFIEIDSDMEEDEIREIKLKYIKKDIEDRKVYKRLQKIISENYGSSKPDNKCWYENELRKMDEYIEKMEIFKKKRDQMLTPELQ